MERNSTRRGFLKTLGSTAAAATISGYSAPQATAFPLNLYQTKEMTETTKAAGKEDKFHALDVLQPYVEFSFNDLFERSGTAYYPDVRQVREPVDLTEIQKYSSKYEDKAVNDPDPQELYSIWDELITHRDDASIEGNALVDDYTGKSRTYGLSGDMVDALMWLGQGCSRQEELSDASTASYAQRLLEVEPGDVQEEFLAFEWDSENEVYRWGNRELFLVWVVNHELGHTSCFEHSEHGKLYKREELEDGRTAWTASIMMGAHAKYQDKFEEGDDLYISLKFSDETAEYFREMDEELQSESVNTTTTME